ncbi:MAG: trigger factor [Dehalococcoidia bacterium]|nr:trigger factor [Dehalococcoidia bacterium]
MKVTKEKLDNSQVELNIEIDNEEREKYLAMAYRHLVNRVAVPGFRKGKAPRFILENLIGKEALLKEAMEHLIPETYSQAVKEQELDTVGDPDIDIVTLEPVVIKASVPVRPAIELGDYKSIRIPVEPVEVSEDAVSNYLDNLRERQAVWEPVERKSQSGDRVTFDLEAMVEGKEMINEKELQLVVVEDSKVLTPGFSKSILDMAGGEEKEFTLPLPEDYPQKEFGGKECNFKVKVSGVKEKKLPELNDDFAKSLGNGFESLADLTNKVTTDLRQVMEQVNRRKHEESVVEAIVSASTAEYSQYLVEKEIDRIIDEKVRAGGKNSVESYLEDFKKSNEEIRNEVKDEAQKRVSGSLVLNKIRENENIEVNEEDVDREIEKLVNISGGNQDQVKSSLGSAQIRASVKNSLTLQKTLKFLSDIASGAEAGEKDTSAEKETK